MVFLRLIRNLLIQPKLKGFILQVIMLRVNKWHLWKHFKQIIFDLKYIQQYILYIKCKNIYIYIWRLHDCQISLNSGDDLHLWPTPILTLQSLWHQLVKIHFRVEDLCSLQLKCGYSVQILFGASIGNCRSSFTARGSCCVELWF